MASITNTTDYKLVYGTIYRDSIYNLGDYATVVAGSGNDTITNGNYYGDYSSLSGGSGNDVIKVGNYNPGVTINGGTGNDTLTGSTYYTGTFQFGNYDGYDVITNYGQGDVIHLTQASSFRHGKSGSNYVIYTAGGRITLKNAANKAITVQYASGNRTTINSRINYITNTTDHKLVYGTTTNDSIYNLGDYATVAAGSGNDTITNGNYYGDYSSLSGGSGNDVIKVGNYNPGVTINGGTGNDTLTGSTYYTGTFQFGNYDGYDVITNYGQGDVIHLTQASSFRHGRSGKDYVIYTAGGRITLKNAAYKRITVKFASGRRTTVNSASSSYISESSLPNSSSNEVFYGDDEKVATGTSFSKPSKDVASLWFDDASTTVSDSTSISEITKAVAPPTTSLEKISGTNYENLTRQDNLITYSEK